MNCVKTYFSLVSVLMLAANIAAPSASQAANAVNKKPVPQAASAQSAKGKQTCEVNGKKGFRPAGSDTCLVISGYVYATAGSKKP